jgi:hypothetical protein
MTWRQLVRALPGKKRPIRCMIQIPEYEYRMNNVDHADQLRGSYQIDKWTRDRKWWWEIWMRGLETLLFNAYVLCREIHHLVWKTEKKKMLNHYQFQ